MLGLANVSGMWDLRPHVNRPLKACFHLRTGHGMMMSSRIYGTTFSFKNSVMSCPKQKATKPCMATRY